MVSRFLLTLTALLFSSLPAAAQPETSQAAYFGCAHCGFHADLCGGQAGLLQTGRPGGHHRSRRRRRSDGAASGAGHAAICSDAGRVGRARQSAGVQPSDHSAFTGRETQRGLARPRRSFLPTAPSSLRPT